jgi:hypothetical protein
VRNNLRLALRNENGIAISSKQPSRIVNAGTKMVMLVRICKICVLYPYLTHLKSIIYRAYFIAFILSNIKEPRLTYSKQKIILNLSKVSKVYHRNELGNKKGEISQESIDLCLSSSSRSPSESIYDARTRRSECEIASTVLST